MVPYFILTGKENGNVWRFIFRDANHFGLVKSYNMPCTIESASLEPKYGNKFIAGGEDMWIRVFDFHTGDEIACNKGHHGPVHCVRFSPGGESYA
ncbi:serine-threonine kinase receptor-associated protein-like [Mangifera indica]|uniref:serine-threonine kinase receptor-associated protein-like n=1 Tax=Mangifera indica TaxID=29780 RepID=UPI001CFC0F88|nr:serine-threonine kinase receptor-associated protein-like [Mangifera indica]